MDKKNLYNITIVAAVIIVVNIISAFFFFRLDLTSEKRFSISNNTKKLMKSLDKKTTVIIYLDGDLNPDFLRLKKATKELIEEFKAYTSTDFSYEFVNPSEANGSKERDKNYAKLESRGLRAYVTYDKDDEGKAVRQVLFPWAEIVYGGDTIPVKLLQNNPNKEDSENLNNSIENLEFAFTDALRVKINKRIEKIAFIEGHGEFSPELVYDASMAFSRYFQVDRGRLGSDASVLDNYKAIVIAGPQSAFTEREKFIIDQYIMNGGRVLWLLNGVRMSMEDLSRSGLSPAIPLDLNLDDQLFRYGVRIVPVLLEDMQCQQVPINVARPGDPAKFQPMPFYYSPLLLTSPEHPITRNIMEVKSSFTSGVDLSVSKNAKIKKSVLLVTSNATHLEMTPTKIDLNTMQNMDSKTFFTNGYVPVAAALEGVFPSVFANRMPPDSLVITRRPLNESKPTRMVVVANADIIRNDVQGSGAETQIVPLGYDRYTGMEYGNRNFILNSLLYLADDDGWLQLRSRDFKLRLLNKKVVVTGKRTWQVINVALPLVVLLTFASLYLLWRKKTYTK